MIYIYNKILQGFFFFIRSQFSFFMFTILPGDPTEEWTKPNSEQLEVKK